jgi:hypothetical protein
MTKQEQILLEYVINKSYSEAEAFEILNKYDSVRTGKPLEEVTLTNTLIRNGDIKTARKIHETN